MPPPSPPSPMALSKHSQTASIFRKRAVSPASAASYLAALSQADASARARTGIAQSFTTTPALSMSSSITSLEDTESLDATVNASEALVFPMRPPTSAQNFTTRHTEFGHCAEPTFRTTSFHPIGIPLPPSLEQDPPYYILFSTYISYLILIVIGHVRDFVGKRVYPASYRDLMPRDGYASLNSDFDSFYTRRLKTRIDQCFTQPVTGVAGRTIMLLDRMSPDYNHTQILTGTRTLALNVSSYNYLGFAQSDGGCTDAVEESIRRYGIAALGSRLEGGASDLLGTAEALVAKFVGMEDAMICSMGFATNSTYIPALVGKGCLVISDELNHASIRFGVRVSGAHVRMFKHNDMANLEALLREVIGQGQPKTHRPWKKIMVIVEGLFSMEGTMSDIPVLLALKRKYKFYLYIDEAHSVGALGPHGRGVVDFFGADPRSVDILMGTFTKSFGAAGGYIAGSKALVDRLRVHGQSGPYAEAMAPPVIAQIIASMASIMGVQGAAPGVADGTYHHPGPAPVSALPAWLRLAPELASGAESAERLKRLAFNSRYMHKALKRLGFITYGHPASPIVPLLLFNLGKLSLFHHLMRARALPIVVVVVAYPGTSLTTGRVRFCMSAAHTKEDVDEVLRACDEIGDLLDLKHGCALEERWTVEECTQRAVDLGSA